MKAKNENCILKSSNVRNGTIDVLKFVSCAFIVMYHFNIYTETKQYFPGGKFGVEVFCMVAGAFFFQRYLRQRETITAWKYFKSRFFRFFPYTTSSFFLLYGYLSITSSNKGIIKVVNQMSKYIWEICLVSMCGINAGNALLNSPTWTISCLLIVETIAIGILICYEKAFYNIVIPVSLFVCYGVWMNLETDYYRTWLGFANSGVIQVWCAVILGILSNFLAEKLGQLKKRSSILTIAEALCYVGIFTIMLFQSNKYWQLTVTALCFFGVSITMSRKSYSGAIFRDSGFTRLLGRLSFAIYLNHSLLLKIFQNIYGPQKMFENCLLFWMALLTVAVVYDCLMRKMIQWGSDAIRMVKAAYFYVDGEA